MPARRERWTPGAVLKIPISDGYHTYGILRQEPEFSVLDARTTEDLELKGLTRRPVLFSIMVMGRALKEWQIAGAIPLPPAMERSESFVKRDRVSCHITVYTDGHERPAASSEAESLESAAVWDPEHVVDRLRDHYAGRPNLWVQSLRNQILTGDGRVRDS